MYQVINDTFLSTVHNDGGLVEKSLNYNANDMDSRRTMYEFAKVMYPDSLKNLLNYSKMIHYWDKLVEGYSSNLWRTAVNRQQNRGRQHLIYGIILTYTKVCKKKQAVIEI